MASVSNVSERLCHRFEIAGVCFDDFHGSVQSIDGCEQLMGFARLKSIPGDDDESFRSIGHHPRANEAPKSTKPTDDNVSAFTGQKPVGLSVYCHGALYFLWIRMRQDTRVSAIVRRLEGCLII